MFNLLKKIHKHNWVLNRRPFLADGGMCKKVELRCTECGKLDYKDWDGNINKYVSGTFIFCPICNKEMLNEDDSLTRDGGDEYTLKCIKCNHVSDWFMTPQTPIMLPRGYVPEEKLKSPIFSGLYIHRRNNK